MRSTFSSLIVGLVIILIIGFGGYYIITKLRANADVNSTSTAIASADINKDGKVNALDLNAMTNAIAAKSTDKRYDLNGDGVTNVLDLNILISQYSK